MRCEYALYTRHPSPSREYSAQHVICPYLCVAKVVSGLCVEQFASCPFAEIYDIAHVVLQDFQFIELLLNVCGHEKFCAIFRFHLFPFPFPHKLNLHKLAVSAPLAVCRRSSVPIVLAYYQVEYVEYWLPCVRENVAAVCAVDYIGKFSIFNTPVYEPACIGRIRYGDLPSP